MIGGELPIAVGGDRQTSTKADVHQGLFSVSGNRMPEYSETLQFRFNALQQGRYRAHSGKAGDHQSGL